MDNIKNFIEELGINAFETNIKIAGLAVISESGNLIYQTKNWDVSNQIISIINVIRGETSLFLNGIKFLVVKTINDGIIMTSEGEMGHIIFAPFQGGVLVSYAMPQADPSKVLAFLKGYALRLSEKL